MNVYDIATYAMIKSQIPRSDEELWGKVRVRIVDAIKSAFPRAEALDFKASLRNNKSRGKYFAVSAKGNEKGSQAFDSWPTQLVFWAQRYAELQEICADCSLPYAVLRGIEQLRERILADAEVAKAAEAEAETEAAAAAAAASA